MDEDTTKAVVLPVSKPPGKGLMVAGIGFTMLYLGFVAIYWSGSATAVLDLDPNEFGDFLAGVFAPLAFLWLVLGFIQQGHELRNSAEALWLQGRELHDSVEQQRELVNITREQLKFESEMLNQQREEIARNAMPILKLTEGMNMGGSEGGRVHEFNLFNYGRPCSDLLLSIDGEPVRRVAVLEKGSKADFRREFLMGEVAPFMLAVTFLDERSISRSQTFLVSRAADQTRFKIADVL